VEGNPLVHGKPRLVSLKIDYYKLKGVFLVLDIFIHFSCDFIVCQ
jgi:hypothetical protein